jgi:hypothetical protein
MVCTSDRLARNADGKAVGFDRVTTVLEEVSGKLRVRCCQSMRARLLWHTFTRRTTDGAGQRDILFAGAAVEQVAAVGAEDE